MWHLRNWFRVIHTEFFCCLNLISSDTFKSNEIIQNSLLLSDSYLSKYYITILVLHYYPSYYYFLYEKFPQWPLRCIYIASFLEDITNQRVNKKVYQSDAVIKIQSMINSDCLSRLNVPFVLSDPFRTSCFSFCSFSLISLSSRRNVEWYAVQLRISSSLSYLFVIN